MITAEQLAAGTGATQSRAERWLPHLQEAMGVYAIDTPVRIAAFLAQIGHESGRLVYTREIWGPTPAQLRYEGRKDLGNLRPGDGRKYLGRGLIQVTGRGGAIAARDALLKVYGKTPDFEASPELLELDRWAAASAAEFWHRKGCNELADAGDFTAITRRINGGTNGLEDRMALWEAGKEAIVA